VGGNGPGRADIERLIRQQIAQRLSHKSGPALQSIEPDDVLTELGLESLDLLELADHLETALGVNPFDADVALFDMRTVSDFCGAYTAAVSQGRAGDAAAPDPLLDAARRRAELRRRQRP